MLSRSPSSRRLSHFAGWALLALVLVATLSVVFGARGRIEAQGYELQPLSANARAVLQSAARDTAAALAALLVTVVVPLRFAGRLGARRLATLWGLLPALALWGSWGLRYNRFEIPSLWRERIEVAGVSLPRALGDGRAIATNLGLTLGAIVLALALIWILRRVLPLWRAPALPRPLGGLAFVGLVLLGLAAAIPPTMGRATPPAGDVILVSLDAMRADRLGAYGGPAGLTPALDRLAQDAEVYQRAYCQEPWTLTSHMSMLTALYPDAHGLDFGRSLAPSVWTLAERLRDAGWRTAGSVFDCFLLGPRFGYADGFDRYRESGMRAGERAVTAAKWLRADPRPGFLFLHFYDPHSDTGALPYEAESPWLERWAAGATAGFDAWTGRGGASESLRRVNEEGLTLPDSLRASLRRLYDAGVAETDAAVGVFLDALRESGRYDDALIVVVADHGEALGEDGHFMHEKLIEETLHVPLLVKWPKGERAGRRRGDIVETVDIAPSVLAAVGLPAPEVSQGRDLRASTSPRRFSLHRSGPEHAITTEDGWRLRYRWDEAAGLQPLGLRRAGEQPGDGPERPDSLAAVVDRWVEPIEGIHRANRTLAARFSGGDFTVKPADEDLLRSLGYIE